MFSIRQIPLCSLQGIRQQVGLGETKPHCHIPQILGADLLGQLNKIAVAGMGDCLLHIHFTMSRQLVAFKNLSIYIQPAITNIGLLGRHSLF